MILLRRLLEGILLFLASLLLLPQLAFAQELNSGSFMFRAVTGNNSGEVILTWNKQDSINNYDLVFGEKGQQFSFGAQDIGNVNSYVVRFLQPGKTYDFALRAKKVGGMVITTERVNAVANAQVAPVPMVKSAVAQPAPVSPAPQVTSGPVQYNLQAATGKNTGEVNLSWDKNSSVDSFDVVYGTEPGKFTFGAQDITWSGLTVKGLEPGRTYYFRLLPQKADKFINWTDQVKATAR